MKKVFMVMLMMVISLSFVGLSGAVPPGKKVEFKGGPMGKVIFDGTKHNNAVKKLFPEQKISCKVCHTKIFKMKKGADKFKMKDIYAGKYCGTCHNGTKAFNAKDAKNCKKCHVKK